MQGRYDCGTFFATFARMASAKRRRIWGARCCAALALAAGLGCSDTDHSSTKAVKNDSGVHDTATGDAGAHDAGAGSLRVLVGAVDGSDIAVGAIIADRYARMFFCGGASSYASATHWFPLVELGDDSDADAGFDQTSADGFSVRGSVLDATLNGELTRKGEPPAKFSADLVQNGTLAGLYEGTSDCGRVGLIVRQASPKGAVRAQGACVGPGHLPEQVNPILPVTLGADGAIAVELVTDDGKQDALVRAAAGPSTP
jgi:hypothetical protein